MPSLIRDKKSGIFYIITFTQGKRVWRSTRTRNRREACEIFSKTPKSTTPNEPKTLSECIREYVPHVRTNFAAKTLHIYELTLKHLLETLGDVEVNSITSRHIDLYKVERAGKVSPATVNIELRTIKAFFNCLKRWDIIAKNPSEGIKQIRIPEQPPVFFDEEELKKLVGSIADPWLKNIVVFAVMTGVRIGEALNLRWDDVNFADKMITIRSSETYRVKGGKMRAIPMNETVFELLSRSSNSTGLVFKGKRGGIANPNFVSEKFREHVRRGGFDRRLHFHSLRHTFASLLVKKRVSLYQVQRLLGHSSSQMTEKYAHLQSSKMQDIVNEINIVDQ